MPRARRPLDCSHPAWRCEPLLRGPAGTGCAACRHRHGPVRGRRHGLQAGPQGQHGSGASAGRWARGLHRRTAGRKGVSGNLDGADPGMPESNP